MDRKQAFKERVEIALEELDARFDRLKESAADVASDARSRTANQLEALKAQRARVAEKVAELRDSGEDAWDEIRQEINDMMSALRKRIDHLMGRDGSDEGEEEVRDPEGKA